MSSDHEHDQQAAKRDEAPASEEQHEHQEDQDIHQSKPVKAVPPHYLFQTWVVCGPGLVIIALIFLLTDMPIGSVILCAFFGLLGCWWALHYGLKASADHGQQQEDPAAVAERAEALTDAGAQSDEGTADESPPPEEVTDRPR